MDASNTDDEMSAARGRRAARPPSLPKALRNWATLQGDDASDCKVVLHRSNGIRIAAVLMLTVCAAWAAYGMSKWVSRFPTDLDPLEGFSLLVLLGVPGIWAANALRRRTILSEDGVEMRRLLFTERRPWTSVLSRFELSTIEMKGEAAEGRIDRTRIVLVNGASDDVIRLPGCLIGSSVSKNSRTRGRSALYGLKYFISRRKWNAFDVKDIKPDIGLLQARLNHGGEKMADKARLTFFTPMWRRIKEGLCDRELFCICMGALCLLAFSLDSSDIDSESRNAAVEGILLLSGGALIAYPAYKSHTCFRRVVVTPEGIRTAGRSFPWPASRSSLFVAGDRIFLADRQGRPVALDGAGVALGGFQRRQEKLVARCEAIWYWGVAHGATRESGRYVPLTDADMQREREIFEKRSGITAPSTA